MPTFNTVCSAHLADWRYQAQRRDAALAQCQSVEVNNLGFTHSSESTDWPWQIKSNPPLILVSAEFRLDKIWREIVEVLPACNGMMFVAVSCSSYWSSNTHCALMTQIKLSPILWFENCVSTKQQGLVFIGGEVNKRSIVLQALAGITWAA